MKLKGWILEAAILAAGVIVMGLCLKTGIDNYVNKDRKVTVKGLSERQVKANHVTWPITLKETGDDLQELHMVMSSKKGYRAALLENQQCETRPTLPWRRPR
jgi:hypothetical protein